MSHEKSYERMYLSTKRDSKESAYTKWLCWDRKKVPGVEAVNKEIKGGRRPPFFIPHI